MPLPLLPLAIAGASGLVGALSNRGRTSKSSQTTTQSTTPEADGLNSVLMNLIRSRLQGSTDLSGYSAEGIKGINATYDDANTGLSAELTARGLSDSPAAAAPLSRMAAGRAGTISQFRNSLPLVQRQLQEDDMGMASRLYALQPRTVTSTGTHTTPGNMLGGGLSDMASMLAFLYGSGAFGGAGGGSPSTGLNLFQIPRI